MLEQPRVFGAELRRLRHASGLTLTQLAALVHYSKSQISKVETGRKQPGTEFARLCDVALSADGALAALLAPPPVPAAPVGPYEDTGAGMRGTPEPGRRAVPVPGTPTRRQVMAVGAVSVMGSAPATAAAADPAERATAAEHAAALDLGGDLLETSRALFDQYRRLGQLAPAGSVLPVLTEQVRSLTALADRCGPRTGRGLRNLAARYAEFAGWMAQERGDDAAALRHTDQAASIAAAAGDPSLTAYALVRRALISYYRGDAADAIACARGADDQRVSPRIRGLAAQHLAQGHALLGDHHACLRELDRSRALLERDQPDPAQPVLGPSHLHDPVTMITGWCLLDLGRPRQAAETFDAACAALPAHALRTQARYGVRRALAHAVSGEAEHACKVVRPLLSAARAVDSATVRLDVRRLARTLGRFPRRPGVVELSPDLTAVLHPA